MSWLQLTFFTDQASADRLSNLLSGLGALSVTLKEGGEQQIFEPLPGETPLWSETQVVGLFDQDTNEHKIISALAHALAGQTLPEYHVEILQDQDWERAWLDEFKPMCFGKNLWIIPSAYEPQDPAAVNIFLDPGLAFGTGTHATTAMCLQWLDTHKAENKVVVDYGCGSGVLAIAAAKLGANLVHAVDIDPQALEATKANAIKNSVADKISCYLSEEFELKAADLLLANILANPLMSLVELFATLVKADGAIVLSGILRAQAEEVINKYSKWFDLDEPTYLDDWVMLSGIRNSQEVRGKFEA